MLKIKRALISVSDKTGLEALAKVLAKFGVEMISTGGTSRAIAALGMVKTMHPKIHGGLLALRADRDHMATAAKHGIDMIDMVVVNLYPFEKTVADPKVKLEEAIENIDIGGPSMLRSAAKNYRSVCVVCDPSDYGRVISEMEDSSGSVSDALLKELGIKAFGRTSAYDAAIYKYLKGGGASAEAAGQDRSFPRALSLDFIKLQDLRYGENPHQKAAFYRDVSSDEPGVSSAVQLHGKELSFNNIIDLDAALGIVGEFDQPASAIIKHTNPCGAASAKTLRQAYIDALDCDRLSAFGGVIGFNHNVDRETADTILSEADFVECIIAPSYEAGALEALKAKKNLRIIEVKGFGARQSAASIDLKRVAGGLLVQQRDLHRIAEADLKVVTRSKPTQEEMASLLFGWNVVKHVKSNAIVLCRGTSTVGIGAGQMSRVESVAIAARKAGARAKGSALASDAFFPKEDSVEEAARAGVRALIQPGGSVRDADVIRKADELGLAMVFTGIRHFKH